MQEIISCPSCQRKLQVPDNLLGQDVQCPTCGAAFVARGGGDSAPGQAPPPPRATDYGPAGPPRAPDHPPPAPRDYDRYDRPRRRDDYDDDYDRGYRRRPYRRDMAPHRGSTILTLGILSLVLCGPIMGPIAWAMGHADMNEIRAGRMDPEGEG